MSLAGRNIAACRVRPASAADEVGWRQLWHAYCVFYSVRIPTEITDTLWRRIVDPEVPIYAMVAETAGAPHGEASLVGFANYVLHLYTWGTDPICYLEDLFVSEHARGSGVGSAIIKDLIALAKKKGWPRLYWHTHELNEVARSVYDKFTPVDPFVRYVVKAR